jgi:hypothetical protein
MDTDNFHSTGSNNGTTGETNPLLSRSQGAGEPLAKPGFFSQNRGRIYLLFIVVAGLQFSMYMINLPLTRVYESIACYAYYSVTEPGRFDGPGSIPENMCKIDPAQEELALIMGYESLCMYLPG